MKMKGNLAGILAMASMMEGVSYPTRKERQEVRPDTEGQIERKKRAYEEVLREKGMQWFNVKGAKILAINRKNAERKYKKIYPDE